MSTTRSQKLQPAACVVIGGGIIGVMTAYYLTLKGIPVTLCEKGEIAGEQSSRNWGWVRVQGRDTREILLAVHSQRLWHKLALEVGPEAIGFRPCGVTYLTNNAKTLEKYVNWVNATADMRPKGFGCNVIDAADAGEILQAPDTPFIGGITTPSDCRAEPALAVPVFAEMAKNAGAIILTNCAVRGIETEAGRISEVVTEKGTIKTSSVVLAGGTWSSLFCRSLGIRLPQLKIHATVCRTKPAPLVTQNAVNTENCSFRRRLDGGYTLTSPGSNIFPLVPDALRFFSQFWPLVKSEVFNGKMKLNVDLSIFEELGHIPGWKLDGISPFEKNRILNPKPSASHVQKSLKAVEALSPAFGTLELAESWAGMIDVTPDVIPVMDKIDALPGFHIATGFSGHGFGVGPAAGHALADIVTGDTPTIDLKDFCFSRFSDGTELEMQKHL